MIVLQRSVIGGVGEGTEDFASEIQQIVDDTLVLVFPLLYVNNYILFHKQHDCLEKHSFS